MARRRPGLRQAFSNWNNSNYTLAERTRLTIKNNAIKLRTGKPCCGNHGEPGC